MRDRKKTRRKKSAQKRKRRAIRLLRRGKKKPEIKEQADYIFDALEKSLKKRDFEGVTLAFTALRYFAIVQKKLKIDVEKISDGIAAVME